MIKPPMYTKPTH